MWQAGKLTKMLWFLKADIMSFYVHTEGISAGKTAWTLSARHLGKTPDGKRWRRQVRQKTVSHPQTLPWDPQQNVLTFEYWTGLMNPLAARITVFLLISPIFHAHDLALFILPWLTFLLTKETSQDVSKDINSCEQLSLLCPQELPGSRQECHFLGTALSMSCNALSCFP